MDPKNNIHNSTRTILNCFPDPVLIIAHDLQVLFANEAAHKLAGKSGGDDSALFCHQFFHGREKPCDSYGDDCPAAKIFESGEAIFSLQRLFTNRAVEGLFEVNAIPLFDESGQVSSFVEILKRIPDQAEPVPSGRHQVDRQHDDSKFRNLFDMVAMAKKEWETAMDHVSDMVVLIDNDFIIKRCNKAFAEYVGKAYRYILGSNFYDIAEDRGLRGFSPSLIDREEELNCRRSGAIYQKLSYKVAIEKGLNGYVVTMHDITERQRIAEEQKEANKQLAKNRQDLQRALDELAILIQRATHEKDYTSIVTLPPNLDQCWKSMRCNHTECPCYGREPMMCWEIAGTFCGGKIQGDFAQKYGDCRKCRFYQVSIADPTLQIGIQFNHMMHILEKKNSELKDAYSDLKSTQSQILQQEKMATIGQLAAGVAHEINNPVGFVRSNLGTLGKYAARLGEFISVQAEVAATCADAEKADDLTALRKKLKIDHVLQDITDLVNESIDGVERVKNIVQNLKSFSRVDQAERGMVNINDCIDDTLNIVWNELKYKTTVNKEYGQLPLTRCYPQQLNQVFMNILVNAAQAIEKQGEITIKTWAENNLIFIAISDTGSGIPENIRERLFEPFFTTKDVGKGTGLGLSIVYDIVTKKHNGTISVASEIGKGSTFTVELPVVEED